MISLNNRRLLTTERVDEISSKMVAETIKKHVAQLRSDYQKSEDMYMSKHSILKAKKKEAYKPDNRLVLNYAKYIIDTFTGYHLGVPVKVYHPEIDEVTEFVEDFRRRNDMEDSEFEVAKMSSVFGHAFIYLYQNEDGETCVTYESPLNMVMVYDNSVQEKPFFAVRYVLGEGEKKGYGELITDSYRQVFALDNALDVTLGERENHVFAGLPVIELIENNERQGLFECVNTLIEALNKTVSEKANDVDYFADAYLKIVGVELDNDIAATIKDNRVINLFAQGPDKTALDAEFLDKPNADTTQENLIRLLIDNIFTISMVANIADEKFGASSGVALAYKLQPMDNLAKTKDRKLKSALSEMYRLVFSVPTKIRQEDEWQNLLFRFTRNVPKNLVEEATVVKTLEGQVSKETQLSILSIIDSPTEEIERLSAEENKAGRLSQRLEGKKGAVDDQDEQANDKSVLA